MMGLIIENRSRRYLTYIFFDENDDIKEVAQLSPGEHKTVCIGWIPSKIANGST